MSNVKYFTEEGLKKLKDELNHLITVERPAIACQISEARDKGDLSENAEYDAAKNAQGMLEYRIAKIQEDLSCAKIIDESKIDLSKVLILSKVKLLNMKTNKEFTYTIVPDNEADFKAGKISISSPIAQGLLGKTVDEEVDIKVPAGIMNFKIINISR